MSVGWLVSAGVYPASWDDPPPQFFARNTTTPGTRQPTTPFPVVELEIPDPEPWQADGTPPPHLRPRWLALELTAVTSVVDTDLSESASLQVWAWGGDQRAPHWPTAEERFLAGMFGFVDLVNMEPSSGGHVFVDAFSPGAWRTPALPHPGFAEAILATDRAPEYLYLPSPGPRPVFPTPRPPMAQSRLGELLLDIASQSDGETVTQDFTSSGTWTCPAGVTSVFAECIGKGGQGQIGSVTDDSAGGGGGEYANRTIAVTPGNNYSYNVNDTGSWFSTSGTVFANPGNPAGPVANTPGTGGTGGIGDVTRNGGTGGVGGSNTGGGGGGAGGPTSAGSTGTAGSSGGAGGAGGGSPAGAGGAGGAVNTNGTAGSAYGGGGGGSGRDTGGSPVGGAGDTGVVRLTYRVSPGQVPRGVQWMSPYNPAWVQRPRDGRAGVAFPFQEFEQAPQQLWFYSQPPGGPQRSGRAASEAAGASASGYSAAGGTANPGSFEHSIAVDGQLSWQVSQVPAWLMRPGMRAVEPGASGEVATALPTSTYTVSGPYFIVVGEVSFFGAGAGSVASQ